MTTRWQTESRSASHRANADFREKVSGLGFRQRFDTVMLLILTGTLLALSGFWLAWVAGAGRLGFFSPREIEPIEDPRLLTNVRDNVARHPFLDAEFHAPERSVYLSQADGTIHRYDPATKLWRSERPFSEGDGIDPRFALLRSGCGTAADSDRAGDCPDRTSVWALSENGGLARLNMGQWSVSVGDFPFLGLDGMPVDGESASSAAVSSDRRWLAVGTQGQGVGIYDIRSRTWLDLGEEGRAVFKDRDLTHAVWWRDRFWIGGSRGLAVVSPEESGVTATSVEGVSGSVMDLDADTERGLLVLTRKPCKAEGIDCLWLGRFDEPEQEPVVLLDEGNRYPGLSLAELHFAASWRDTLVLAGFAGIYTYDTRTHGWSRPFEGHVTTVMPIAGSDGFYFGSESGLGIMRPGDLSHWPVHGRRFVAFSHAPPNILALTENGSVYKVGETAPPELVFHTGETSMNPARFTNATSLGDTVMFSGPEGVLLHDIEARTYRDLAPTARHSWLLGGDLDLMVSGNHLYALSKTNEKVFPFSLPLRSATVGNFATPSVGKFLQAPVRHARDWDGTGIGLLAGDGRLYQVTPGKTVAHTGPHNPALGYSRILDVTEYRGDLVIATSSGIHSYDLDARSWEERSGLSLEGSAVELDSFDGVLLARNDRGQLVRERGRYSVMIGDGPVFPFSDESLSDVMGEENRIFLAGQGKVVVYDKARRRIERRWELPTRGEMRLVGTVAETPLTLADRVAYLGETAIEPEAGQVRSLFMNQGLIWTLREKDGHRYLKAHAADLKLGRCIFRNPPPPITDISAAATLPDGTVAAATDRGLHFYDPRSRNWFYGPPHLLRGGGEMLVVSKQLVLIEPDQDHYRVTLVPVASIEIPDSCSQEPVVLRETVHRVSHVAVDRQMRQVAWVGTGGEVVLWSDGQAEEIMAGPSRGPDPGQLRHAYFLEQGGNRQLAFLTSGSLWRYDLNLHRWHEMPFLFPVEEQPQGDADLVFDGEKHSLILKTLTGRWYEGKFALTDDRISLRLFYGRAEDGYGGPVDELLDVQRSPAGSWVFVSTDRVAYYDPQSRRWEGEHRFEKKDPSRTFARLGSRVVVTEDRDRTWWVAANDSVLPESFYRYRPRDGETTAIDGAGTLWRLGRDGGLQKSEEPQNGAFTRFQNVGPRPFRLNPEKAIRAFEWQKLLIFETVDGFRAWDRESGQEMPLPNSVRFLWDLVQVREFAGHLWFLCGEGLVQLGYGGADALTAQTFPKVSALVLDSYGNPWARFEDGWRIWRNTAFREPIFAGSPDAVGDRIEMFLYEGQTPSGIDDLGRLYTWENGLVPHTPDLPVQIVEGGLDDLFPGLGEEWWVRKGRRVQRLVRDQCASGSGATKKTFPCFAPAERYTLKKAFAETGAPGLSGMIPGEDGQLVLFPERGPALRLYKGFLGWRRVVTDTGRTLNRSGSIEDRWPELKKRFVLLDNGQWTFMPFTGLINDVDGRLFAIYPDGAMFLAETGSAELERPPALNLEWLAWNRRERTFSVRTTTGVQTLRHGDFMREGKMFFEAVDALARDSAHRFLVANWAGIWRLGGGGLGLNRDDILFHSKPMNGPVKAVHGKFLDRMGAHAFEDEGSGSLEETHRFRFGDVLVTEDLRKEAISFSVIGAGMDAPVLDSRGFIWDRHRRGLAFDMRGSLLLVSEAGIHGLEDLTAFDAGPPGFSGDRRPFPPQTDPGIYWQGSGVLHHRGENGWRIVSARPESDNLNLDNSAWGGFLERHGFEKVSGNPAFPARMTATTANAFEGSRPTDAVALDGRIFLLTGRQLEVVDQGLNFSDSDLLGPVPAGGSLRMVSDGASAQDLVFTSPGERLHWSREEMRFVSLPETAETGQVLFEDGRLRFSKTNGRVVKELRVENADRQSSWVAYDFVNDRFPFDVVTCFAAKGGDLFVGSAAGLQTYHPPLQTGIGDMDQLLDLRGDSGGPLVSVQSVGIPEDRMDVIRASSARETLEKLPGAPFRSVGASSTRWSRIRAISPFWRWTGIPGTEVRGQYMLEDGQPLSRSIELSDGRFPHDRILDAVVFDGEAFTIWRSGLVSVHGGRDFRVDEDILNHSFVGAEPRRFIVLDRAYHLQGQDLAKGLYLEDMRGGIARFNGRSWIPQEAGVGAAVLAFAKSPPIVYRSRWRLLPRTPDNPSFQFEHRAENGDWHAIPWVNGRVAIDDWQNFIYHEHELWAATAAGFTAFEVARDGTVELDPNRTEIVRDLIGRTDAGPVTDLEMRGGSLLVRCEGNSEKLFQGELGGTKERGLFRKYGGPDPFAERVLVEGDGERSWRWRLVNRRGTDPGMLTARFGGEELHLVAGGFPFDRINSLAFFDEGHLDFATDAGGWLRSETTDLALGNLRKPEMSGVDPLDVARIGLTWTGEETALYLRRHAGSAIRLRPGNPPEGVADALEYLGFDGMWRYFQDGSHLAIRADDSKGGAGIRQLVAGRFNDDHVLSPPLAAEDDRGLFYLMPTRAGILRIDGSGTKRELYAPPFPGLEEERVPAALLMLPSGDAVYYDGSGLRNLEGAREMKVPLRFALPEDASPLALSHGPHQTIRLNWEGPSGRGWNLLSTREQGAMPDNRLLIDVSGFDVFIRNRLSWGSVDPWLTLAFDAGRLEIARPGGGVGQRLSLPKIGALLKPVPVGDRLLVFGSRDLVSVDLAPSLLALFNGETAQAKR